TVVLNATSGALTFNGVTQGQTRNQATAVFSATGEPSYLYTITLPQTATLTQAGAGPNRPTMTATSFTYSDGAGTLDNSGHQTFNVGATLNVGANQATGTYNGSFDVTVQYQ
ncbi:MAG TPA: DUF4402 domain-containing protein, partial [Candidatus Kapabacteria bacterium]|nr:DUF4402 domain-containing protein [Candidatus Kapabacteria bacterium]